MGNGVGMRADHPLLFARKQYEPNAAPRTNSGRFNRAQGINHQRRVAAIIESAGAKLPRVKMCSQDYKLVGLLASTNFRDHIRCTNRPSNLVWDCNVRIQLLSGSQQASHTPRVFASDQPLRNAVQFAIQRIGVAIQEIMRASRLERDRERIASY